MNDLFFCFENNSIPKKNYIELILDCINWLQKHLFKNNLYNISSQYNNSIFLFMNNVQLLVIQINDKFINQRYKIFLNNNKFFLNKIINQYNNKQNEFSIFYKNNFYFQCKWRNCKFYSNNKQILKIHLLKHITK